MARLPLLAGLDAVTIAQAIHLLDRPPLFQSLAARMSPPCPDRGRRERKSALAPGPAVVSGAQGVPGELVRYRAALGVRDRTRRAGPAYRAELAAAGFGTATEVRSTTRRPTRSPDSGQRALGPLAGSLPTDPAFEAGLRDALGPGPFEEDVRVSILVAGR